jgi:large subunit ribosomal protein L15
MKLNEIADRRGARKRRMRIGRGIGSGKGKTGGRGGKGQTARSGVTIAGFEGGQMPLHMRMPKRGFNAPFSGRYAEVNLGRLQAAFDKGALKADETVTEASLKAAGLVGHLRDGVRLLAKGELKTKCAIEVTGASKPALDAVQRLGGSVRILPPKAKPQPGPKERKRADKGPQKRKKA